MDDVGLGSSAYRDGRKDMNEKWPDPDEERDSGNLMERLFKPGLKDLYSALTQPQKSESAARE